MVGLLIKASSQTKGAGKNTLSKEDLEAYQSVLNGNKPTIPNKQKDFANFLYKMPMTCKEGSGAACISNMYSPLVLPDNSPDIIN